MEADEKVVFVDIETSGLEFASPIIQIAAVAIDGAFCELETIELKIEFESPSVDRTAFVRNRIDVDVWEREAISPTEAADRFALFLRRHATFDMTSRDGKPYRLAQLAGHNAERFDGPILHAWYRRVELFCPARYMTLCTKQKALWLFEDDKSLKPPTDFKLGTLCQYFDVRLKEKEAHDALVDVRATVELYRAMRAHERRHLLEAA